MARRRRRRCRMPWRFDRCRACGDYIGKTWFSKERVPFSYMTYQEEGKTKRVRVCMECAGQIRSDRASDVRKFAVKLAVRLYRVSDNVRMEAAYFAQRYKGDVELAQMAANLLSGRKRNLRSKRRRRRRLG